MIKITDISWEELDAIDRQSAVVFLSIAPIEEHGKHLPLGVDLFLTEKWQADTIKCIESAKENIQCITFPAIPFGYAELRGFNGNFHIDIKTLKKIVLISLNNIVKWGFKNIVVLSGHADPLHLIAIECCCDAINKKHGEIVIAPMGALFSASEKENMQNEEDPQVANMIASFPNDFHAGWIETSAMLDINAQLVKKNYSEMPDVLVFPQDMLNSAYISKKTKGYGHFGYPGKASKDMGTILNNDMAENLYHIVMQFINRENYMQYKHHSLHNLLKSQLIAKCFSLFSIFIPRGKE